LYQGLAAIGSTAPTRGVRFLTPSSPLPKKYWGVQRSTFIIDPDGRIALIFPRVSPKTHDDQVLGALRELQG
jgi:peroxiredoxin